MTLAVSLQYGLQERCADRAKVFFRAKYAGIAEAGNQGLKDATFIDLYESHLDVQHNALTAPPYSRLL